MSAPKFSPLAFSGTAFALASPGQSAGTYARMMLALLPPGRLWRLVESVLTRLFDGLGEELARVDERAADLVSEAHPPNLFELLPEAEAELELVAGTASIAERQARVVARTIRQQGVRPADYREALAPLLGQLAADVVVLERTHAFAVSIHDDREIFRFFVYRNPALPGTYFLASAQALVDDMTWSSRIGHVIESISLLCDDPFSLTDRDILGA